MSTTSNNHTHDPGQEPDVIEIDTEKQLIDASSKGGKKPGIAWYSGHMG